MPLHRDIHWLGRQWAVTGHGLQLINQKQMGYYDIEVARLWDAGIIQAMQGRAWIDRTDFDRAVEIARVRFPRTAPDGQAPAFEPDAKPPPPATPPPQRTEPPPSPALEELLARLKSRSTAAASAVRPAQAASAPPPQPEPPKAESPEPEPAEAPPPVAEMAGPSPQVTSSRPEPVWPVYGYRIPGKARFVVPWRATVTRWHGILPGLPPRP
jgi:hypothetical protein